MVDVLGIEVLKRRIKKIKIAGRIRNFDVSDASRRHKPAHVFERRIEILHVLEYVTEDDAVELAGFGGNSGQRSHPRPYPPLFRVSNAAGGRVDAGQVRETQQGKRTQ